MDNGILAAGAQDIDFMIHGLFSYKIFGHEVWITTSHVCILIIMLILIAFSFIVKHKMKAATEVPGGFQNVVELMVEKLDGVVDGVMGKNAPKLVNYISTIFIFILMSNISGLFGLRPPYRRLWNDTGVGTYHLFAYPYLSDKVPETKENLGRYVFAVTTMAATVAANQYHQRDCRADFPVTSFVCKRIIRNRNDGIGLWTVVQDCNCLAGSASCVL